MGFLFAYLGLTFAHSKGQGQGHQQLTANIFQMVTDMANIAIAIK